MGKRRDEPRFDIRFEGLEKLPPEARVGMAIIHQAMLDWNLLIARRAWEKETLAKPNFIELRQFFESRWCAQICQRCDRMTPEHMLDLLERELAAAMGNGKADERCSSLRVAKEKPLAGEADR